MGSVGSRTFLGVLIGKFVFDILQIPSGCIQICEGRITHTSIPLACGYRSLRKMFIPLKPNDPYRGRTATLISKRRILYIYSTNTGTEYFKHGIYSPFFSLQNAVCFIILMYLVPVLFTSYIQDVLKFKKNNSGAKKVNDDYLEQH